MNQSKFGCVNFLNYTLYNYFILRSSTDVITYEGTFLFQQLTEQCSSTLKFVLD